MNSKSSEELFTKTGGRPASKGVIPGKYSLSVGMPKTVPPKGWAWVPLSKIARLETGHTPSRKHPEYWDGDVPWIGIRDATGNHGTTIFDTQQHTNDLGIQNSSARVLPANTVCLSRTASVGYVVVMGRPMATSQDFVNWVCSEAIDYRFLKYILLSEHDSMLRFSSGTTHQTIYFPEAKAFHVCIPQIKVQKDIADVLQSLDDRIASLRETNATLEAIAQALFKSWFVDFDPVRAKMEGRVSEGMDEATAALFPDRLEESELGAVPTGWRVRRLGDVSSYLSRGISPKYLEDSGVLVLNQKCIRDFSVDYCKGRRHDSSQRKIEGRQVAIGDVLVNSTGVGTLGRVAQVLSLPEAAVIVDSHITIVRPGPNLSWPYLGQFMIRKQPEIEAMGEGSTGQTELSRSKLAEVLVLVPPEHILVAFDHSVIPMKQRISLNEAGIQNMAKLRDALLPRLISGQLRIPEAEVEIDALAA
jgi:type I restriction enzyme S subunit